MVSSFNSASIRGRLLFHVPMLWTRLLFKVGLYLRSDLNKGFTVIVIADCNLPPYTCIRGQIFKFQATRDLCVSSVLPQTKCHRRRFVHTNQGSQSIPGLICYLKKVKTFTAMETFFSSFISSRNYSASSNINKTFLTS